MIRTLNAAWGQIVVALLALVGVRLYTEWLAPEEFGRAMLLVGAVALLDGLAVAALNQTLLSRCARLADPDARRLLATGLARLATRAEAPVAAGATLLLAAVLPATGQSLVWAALPLGVLLYHAGEFTKIATLSLLVIERDYLRFSVWCAGEAALGLLGIGLAVTLWRPDAVAFGVGYGVARLVSTVLFTLVLNGVAGLRGVDLGPARSDRAAALRYGVPVALMAPLGWVSAYLDRYILGAMLGVGTIGTYVAATSLAGRPYAIVTSVLTNIFRPRFYAPPGAAGRSAVEDPGGQVMWLWTATAACIGLAGAATFYLAGGLVVRLLLAAEYREGAVPLLTGFAVAQTLSIMTHAVDNLVLARGRSARLLQVQTGLSIVTLSAIPLGVWWCGPLGAVLARVGAEAIKFGATAVMAMRLLQGPDTRVEPVAP